MHSPAAGDPWGEAMFENDAAAYRRSARSLMARMLHPLHTLIGGQRIQGRRSSLAAKREHSTTDPTETA